MRDPVPHRAARWRFRLLSSVALYAMAINTISPLAAVAADTGANDGNTTTPIKHVIVIIGENRTFDHLFATYQPVKKGETVLNLLSEGIVKADGTPGPNYSKVAQVQGQDRTVYQLSPPGQTPYSTLPRAIGRRRVYRRGAAILDNRAGADLRERAAAGLLQIL